MPVEEKLKIDLMTYYPQGKHGNGEDCYSEPRSPVMVDSSAAGIRVILGSHDKEDDVPNLLNGKNLWKLRVERRPGGWAIVMWTFSVDCPSGCVYLTDDGKSFVQPEQGPGDQIRWLRSDDPSPPGIE